MAPKRKVGWEPDKLQPGIALAFAKPQQPPSALASRVSYSDFVRERPGVAEFDNYSVHNILNDSGVRVTNEEAEAAENGTRTPRRSALASLSPARRAGLR